MTSRKGSVSSWHAILLFTLMLALTACSGGGGGSTGGGTGGGGGTNPPPSAANEWAWVGGSSALNQPGVYGSLGVASAGNTPGARYNAVAWSDSSGNFWLFGGVGFDSTGTDGDLSDFWEFNTTTKQWTWAAGSNTANQPGVYGTQGVSAASNTPGARDSPVAWTDSSGNLWLFGGGSSAGLYNDLWRYQP